MIDRRQICQRDQEVRPEANSMARPLGMPRLGVKAAFGHFCSFTLPWWDARRRDDFGSVRCSRTLLTYDDYI
ncbi:hypothetical protein K239x_42350 [Planctomycetes bacterium K23_9]|uniref:Uncharacterized protein n=1 Tax=Stieleria marina TaxID=1930275 RepID=A0A517NYM9_9BACT|nr:hypothetical protein K239x_42350 [Planctomycetes bacterium K23_9]